MRDVENFGSAMSTLTIQTGKFRANWFSGKLMA